MGTEIHCKPHNPTKTKDAPFANVAQNAQQTNNFNINSNLRKSQSMSILGSSGPGQNISPNQTNNPMNAGRPRVNSNSDRMDAKQNPSKASTNGVMPLMSMNLGFNNMPPQPTRYAGPFSPPPPPLLPLASPNFPGAGPNFPGLPLPSPQPNLMGDLGAYSHTLQQHNANPGVDVVVTNLDESINIHELRMKLMSMFREHSKVLSLHLVAPDKPGTMQAYVRVPKLQDVNLCISKLNNTPMFASRIVVSSPSTKEMELLNLKSKVSSLLKDTFAGWLPVDDFLARYKNKYHCIFNVLAFDQMKDIVYVDGRPGIQFVCLLHFPVGLLKLKADSEFEREVVSILCAHNRRVPFARFADMIIFMLSPF